MSATETIPATVIPKASDELGHVACCLDDNLSLCGLDITHLEWADELTDPCAVCADLSETIASEDPDSDQLCAGCPLSCEVGR